MPAAPRPAGPGRGRPRLAFSVGLDPSRPAIAVVTVCGALTAATAAELRDTLGELRRAGRRHLIVDLSAVAELDAVALAVLIGARRRGRANSLRLVAPSPAAGAVLHRTGLCRALRVFPTIPAALDDLAAQA